MKPTDKVILIAIPTGKFAKTLSGGAILFVSTSTQKAGPDTYVILCGFSTELDASNAFPVKFLDDVIHQWTSVNMRGWRFEIRDREGKNPRSVTKQKARK